VYSGALTSRKDDGYLYTNKPYQGVLEADFTSYNTAGEYQVVVPGVGASLPFVIDDGVAMDFARAYALGLYHQRCGTNNVLPFTRFAHNPCHTNKVFIPLPDTSSLYTNAWAIISNYSVTVDT